MRFCKTQGSIYVKIYRAPKLLLFTDERCKGTYIFSVMQVNQRKTAISVYLFLPILNISAIIICIFLKYQCKLRIK